jgi:exopolysaccharide biosynthesis polyprenyl glycosylphosphotransferase
MSQTKFSEHAPPLRIVPPQRTASFRNRLRGAGTVARRAWRAGYVRRLGFWDAACAVVAAGAGLLVRFGPDQVGIAGVSLAIALVMPAVWVVAMLVSGCYEEHFLWEGPEEFRRVFFAAALLLAGVATVSWGLKLEVARGFVVVALPLATALTLVQRLAQRMWLRRRRADGRFQQTTLLVGRGPGVAALHQQLVREPQYGYRVIGCCLPATGAGSQVFDGLPVLGGPDDVVGVVRRYEVDTVAVLPFPDLDGDALRRLGWELERTSAELLLAPAVTEIAGPRVRVRPVCGLSLLQMDRPELRGWRRLVKASFDRTGAALGLLALVPLLVVLAVAVRTTSSGPVLFRQERVGRDGRTFSMLKFRSMRVGAEHMLDQLASLSTGNGVLFKMTHDPRVTRVGKVLRRFSLDELPQLFNVLKGDMSLVGPRPPLPVEVERYDIDMRRRFAVKPGLTGLWQVSGRSDLSWDDSIRIDVHYVEHWSLFMDVMIIWRTFGAVLRGDGAY